jgi:hypothetical protein
MHMLDAVFWGVVAALSLGTADYLARTTSNALRALRGLHLCRHAWYVTHGRLHGRHGYALLVITGQAAATEMGQTSVALVGRAASAAILLAALAGGMFRLPPHQAGSSGRWRPRASSIPLAT